MSAYPNVAGLLTMVDVRFEANEAGLKGGGVYLEGPLGGEMDVDLSGIELVDNVALEDGGGLWAKDVVGQIRDSTLEGNTAWQAGGGALFRSAHVTLDDVAILDNAATDPTSMAPGPPAGGGLAATGTAVVELLATTLSTNTAGGGGGILVEGPAAEVYVYSGSVAANVGQDAGSGGHVEHGRLAGCDPIGVSWTDDVTWIDDVGALQTLLPADGCFEVVAGTAVALDSCSCP